MSVEIERKFLVVGNDWKSQTNRKIHIRDGLLSYSDARKVRVRIADDVATLTIKSKKSKIANFECEYPIPILDAEHLLKYECDGSVLSKVRHFVAVGDLTWEVDVYEALLDGIVLAEVELPSEESPLMACPTLRFGQPTGWARRPVYDSRTGIASRGRPLAPPV